MLSILLSNKIAASHAAFVSNISGSKDRGKLDLVLSSVSNFFNFLKNEKHNVQN